MAVPTAVPLAVLIPGSTLMAVLQAASPVVDTNVIGQIERLGLVGVLILAVTILWRKLESKDAASTDNQVKMTEALTRNTEVMNELTGTVSSLKISVDRMNTVRETLAEQHDNPKKR